MDKTKTEKDKVCCCCEGYDRNGKLVEHVEHKELFKCSKEGCSCYACREHFVDDLCYGCYVEKDLGIGDRKKSNGKQRL